MRCVPQGRSAYCLRSRLQPQLGHSSVAVRLRRHPFWKILPDNGFVGTYATGLLSPGGAAGQFGGGVTGYVARWTPGKGESEVTGTRVAYPNGVVVSADGHNMFLNVFAVREVAFAVGDAIYLGAFQGDRLVSIPYNR